MTSQLFILACVKLFFNFIYFKKKCLHLNINATDKVIMTFVSKISFLQFFFFFFFLGGWGGGHGHYIFMKCPSPLPVYVSA